MISSRKEVLDSGLLARLVEIMKSPNPNLQRKVSSILEYVTIVDPCIESIISVDIQSGLDAVFSTKVLNGKRSNFTLRVKSGIKWHFE